MLNANLDVANDALDLSVTEDIFETVLFSVAISAYFLGVLVDQNFNRVILFL